MSESDPPIRRFAPQPLETTTRSTRKPAEDATANGDSTRNETDIDGQLEGPRKRFAPELTESTTKSTRRFVPVPVEITTKSSRASEQTKTAGTTQKTVEKMEDVERIKPGRFAPMPVETTTKSNRTREGVSKQTPPSASEAKGPNEAPTVKTPRRFAPQPVEMSTKSNKGKHVEHVHFNSEPAAADKGKEKGTAEEKPKRRFAPEPIETITRSRKKGDEKPILEANERRTDFLASEPYHGKPQLFESSKWSNRRKIKADANSDESAQPRNPQRTRSWHPHPNTRQHSFVVPTLESIESSESEEDAGTPSLSDSRSPSEPSDVNSTVGKPGMRESCDERFSGYLLALAARAAEKQLREQAMQAYVNEDVHERVDHFAVDRDSSDDEKIADPRETLNRLTPAIDLGIDADVDLDMLMQEKENPFETAFELRKMQDHVDVGKLDLNISAISPLGEDLARGRTRTRDSHLDNNKNAETDAFGGPKEIIGGWQKNVGLEAMRCAASPPKLGEDLVFRLCHSPERLCTGVDQQHPQSWAKKSTRESMEKEGSGCGLWMGTCNGQSQDQDTHQLDQSGLFTPTTEKGDPFNSVCTISTFQQQQKATGLLPSPPSSAHPSPVPQSTIDDILAAEDDLDEEFNDEFVSNVYNYLALGYPCLARKFDIELSKISGLSIEEIRTDDKRANTKGYVGLAEGDGMSHAEAIRGQCGRWRALRIYAREWGKQNPSVRKGSMAPGGNWGERGRRGSWAI
jgi:hypothetical protein